MEKVTTTEQFIAKAKAMHGDHYDYSNTIYTKSRNKVTFKCNIHHCEVEQLASDHIRSRKTAKNGKWSGVSGGCKMCWHDNKIKNLTHTTESFIAKAKSIHGDKFDYSQTKYTERGCIVKVGCKIHGTYDVEAWRHIDINHPKECPDCGILKRLISSHNSIDIDHDTIKQAKQVPCFLYILKINNSFFKIGITTRTVQKRFASETFTYEVIRLRKTNLYNAFKIEQRFLKLMKKQNRKYIPSKDTMSAGHTECFI